MRNPTLKITLIVATVALGITGAMADSLTVIPLGAWSANTANEGRAITSDGKYVVGAQGADNAFFYDVVNNVVRQVNNGVGAVPNVPVTGIAYRTDPVTLQKQTVLHGASSGYETEWMTTDGGATWGNRRRNTSFTPNVYPTMNSLGSSTANANGQYYATVRATGANGSVYLNQGSGTWTTTTSPTFTYSSKGISGGDTASMNGVSGTLYGDGTKARAVGFRKNATNGTQNYALDYNGTATPGNFYFAGLAGNNVGQAFSVSGDGSVVFGYSPLTVGATDNWGYKATFSGTTETSITRLASFGDELGSGSRQVPYGCTADGFYAVGMDYRGVERAALWFAKDDWSRIIDLTDYATANGLLAGFTRLSRAYSVGETWDVEGNQYAVITGVGIYGGASRGFVMQVLIPEPGTIGLLALGGLLLLVHRRRK